LRSGRRRPCSRSCRTASGAGRLADLVAAVQDGELDEDEAQALEEIIELGLSTGASAACTAPRENRLR
jgi:hypothetical protein